MNKKIIGFLVALLLVLVPTGLVGAATTADITVNATPQYITISVNISTYDFGTVANGSVTNTTGGHFGITNDSGVQTDQTIGVTSANWTGGVGWVHNATCTPGKATAGMKAQRVGQSWVIVKYSSPNYIYENCAASTNYSFDLSLHAPTEFTDEVEKSIVVRITAAAG
jgi:hypothetical protein